MTYDELPARERLPDRLMAAPAADRIVRVTAQCALDARASIRDAVQQLCINTATWGLDQWESLMGLETDYTKDYAARRKAVAARFRQRGNCTPEMVEQAAKLITGYDCKCTEHFADYSFSIRFLGPEATLALVDTDAIKAAVDQIKPAHMEFIITAITWGDLVGLGLTWAQAAGYGPTWGDIMGKIAVHKKEDA